MFRATSWWQAGVHLRPRCLMTFLILQVRVTRLPLRHLNVLSWTVVGRTSSSFSVMKSSRKTILSFATCLLSGALLSYVFRISSATGSRTYKSIFVVTPLRMVRIASRHVPVLLNEMAW